MYKILQLETGTFQILSHTVTRVWRYIVSILTSQFCKVQYTQKTKYYYTFLKSLNFKKAYQSF